MIDEQALHIIYVRLQSCCLPLPVAGHFDVVEKLLSNFPRQ
jgi:hypothetical protein